MNRFFLKLSALPNLWFFGVVILYSLIMSEYYYHLNTCLILNQVDQLIDNSIFKTFISLSFFLIFLSAIIVWLVSSFIFYLFIVLFDGEIEYTKTIRLSAICYIFPAISFIVSIFILNNVISTNNSLSLNNIDHFNSINQIINLGFILYYSVLLFLFRFSTNLSWLKAIGSNSYTYWFNLFAGTVFCILCIMILKI